MTSIQTDEETKKRIKNLSIVGKAISEITNENMGQTNVFLAKTALKEFEEGILKLELDPESLEGMRNLVRYLNSILDKQMTQLA